MRIKVSFLGGLNEIGKNMTLFEFDNEMIILDAGFEFPSADLLGIDRVIPDITYALQNKKKIKAIILSHGHADHIGGLRYFSKDLGYPPIYATALTIGIVKSELPSYVSKNLQFHEVSLPSSIKIGKIRIDFLRVTHSIPDGMATVFHTPHGNVFHGGDFKVDLTPIDGKPIDLQGIAHAGKEGTLLYLGDSTNADEPGFTASEKTVGLKLEDLIRACSGRVIVATFSTNLHRVQQVFDIAEKVNRKVLVDGRSMMNTIQVAKELGYSSIPDHLLAKPQELQNIPDKKLIVLTTGTQGEPFSGLTKMAHKQHDILKLKKGDKVIISADPIPGNEASVTKNINSLIRLGADVVYRTEGIHASGHGSKEDLRLMMSLIKPTFFIPVHGEYRMMFAHCKIAHEVGVPEANTRICDNGDSIALTNTTMKLVGKVPAAPIYIDGRNIGDIGQSVINERKVLSREGVLNVVVIADIKKRTMTTSPLIETKGLISSDFSSDLYEKVTHGIQEIVKKWSRQHGQGSDLEIMIKGYLSGFFSSEVHRRPVIFVSVIES
jgi:ribonuclease J